MKQGGVNLRLEDLASECQFAYRGSFRARDQEIWNLAAQLISQGADSRALSEYILSVMRVCDAELAMFAAIEAGSYARRLNGWIGRLSSGQKLERRDPGFDFLRSRLSWIPFPCQTQPADPTEKHSMYLLYLAGVYLEYLLSNKMNFYLEMLREHADTARLTDLERRMGSGMQDGAALVNALRQKLVSRYGTPSIRESFTSAYYSALSAILSKDAETSKRALTALLEQLSEAGGITDDDESARFWGDIDKQLGFEG